MSVIYDTSQSGKTYITLQNVAEVSVTSNQATDVPAMQAPDVHVIRYLLSLTCYAVRRVTIGGLLRD